jgi:glutamyl endopeptidase
MARHESVSSEQIAKVKGQKASESEGDQMHGSVSSEMGGPGGGIGEEFVMEDFRGFGGAGELEAVPGFDPTRALSQTTDGETVPITEADEAILPCCADRPENVCGNDDRVQINQTTEMPWRWICQLIITAADGAKYRCTGWFIGPHTVMTAGHCVYMHDNGGWAKQIEVIPGMNAANRPFGSQVSTVFRSVLGWTKNKDWNYDYGAIILPDNTLGNRVGWFGFAVLPDSSLNNLTANNSGYPGDKPFGTQWFNAGRVTKLTDRKFYYMIDTMGGQSGSPVWRFINGQRHAIGVHAYGGCPNSATRITKAVFDNMIAWKA